MYRHILVPLDGSQLAEQVLPHVKAIAAMEHGVKVTLLRAVPPVYPVTVEYSGLLSVLNDALPEAEREAREYLNGVASRLQAAEIQVTTEISVMPAAEAIIDYAEQHMVDLIIIATHGRSGISRWVFGSVTQKVVQVVPVPVLVIRPSEL